MKDRYLILLRQQMDAVYQTLQGQGSVPPAMRYRAEGIARVGLFLEFVTAPELASMLEDSHLRLLGENFAARQGVDAAQCIDESACLLRIPVRMERAPVWPSTKDE